MDLAQITQQTLDQAAALTKKALSDPAMRKAITTTTGTSGITGYTLEAPAKQLIPLMSPFRQRIPRKIQPGATAVNWKSITAINITTKFTTTESSPASGFTYSTVDKNAAFRVVGRLGSVTREAIAAGLGFDDVKAREVTNTLLQGMKEEEQYILGGNRTALATPTGITLTVRVGQGSLAAAAGGLRVRVAALTLPAVNRLTVDRPGIFDGTDAKLAGNGHAGAAVDPAADGVTVAAVAVVSAAVALNDALKITWTPVSGAAAYAVYIHVTAGSEALEAVVTQANITITSLAGTGALASALTGTSADANAFDGIIAKVMADASSYQKSLGAKLSTSGAEIVELQDAFRFLWDRAKIDEFDIIVGGHDSSTISKLLTAAGGGPTIFVDPKGGDTDRLNVLQGYHVGRIVNAVTGKVCMIQVVPWLPSGIILLLPTKIPYAMANVEYPFEMAAGYGWEQIDYYITATTGPVSSFEVRAYEVLKDYFPAGCGIIYNVLFG